MSHSAIDLAALANEVDERIPVPADHDGPAYPVGGRGNHCDVCRARKRVTFEIIYTPNSGAACADSTAASTELASVVELSAVTGRMSVAGGTAVV